MPALSHAAAVEYKLYLDSDNNSSTGCSVSVAESGYSGTLSGIEQVITLTAQNASLPISVTGITRAFCAGGSFGAPVAVSPGGWSVAAGAGLNGADAIEGYVPLAGLGANGAVRLYVSANPAGQGVADVLLSQNGSNGVPILAALSSPNNSIPALNPGVLVLLALGLAVLGHRRLRRHFPPLAAAMLAVTLGLAGAKSAEAVLAAITPDGNIADWSGIAPAAQDPLEDSGNSDPTNDLAALFLASDSANLYYRVDVAGLALPTLSFDFIADPATVVDGETKTLTFTVDNLSDNFPDAATALAAMNTFVITNGGAVGLDNFSFQITNFANGIFTVRYTGIAGFGTTATDTYQFCLGVICSNNVSITQTAF